MISVFCEYEKNYSLWKIQLNENKSVVAKLEYERLSQ